MKAIVYTEYGLPDVLQLKEVEKPSPEDNEVLVKVHAASVNAYDWHMMRGKPFFLRLASGLLKPRNEIPGVDMAGRIEAVGSAVKQLRPGDEVFGDVCECGGGAFAEYVCASEDALALKPSNMTFQETAAVPMAAVTAVKALRDRGHIQAGQKVLVHGASGGVGTYGVQIAKALGAEVTAVCSTSKLDMVRSIGADHVIDYTQEDFAAGERRYDLILAANGCRSILDYKRALSPNGVCIVTGGTGAQIYQAMFLGSLISMTGSKKIGSMVSRPDKKVLDFLKELIEAGKVAPVIDRCYPLSEVPEAVRYLGDGHAKGKVVVTVLNE
ncbi:MAG: NAD(P)-dependent alcohol dehydrogenase [Lentisphaerae bacterium]|nr:NAD(P)-dependent alcohol dehydrogenase [Lentisphaerota bacterium]